MKKKIVTFFILLISSLPIAAQNFRVGVTAGTNLHSSTNIDARMGFSIGAKGEYGFNGLDEGWYADASLLLESHAWKVEFGELGLHLYKSSRQYTTPWYLNLPIHVGYRFPVSQDVKMLVNAGPFMGIGLFGTSKYEIVFMDGNTEKETFSLSQMNNVELARTLSWRENALFEEREKNYLRQYLHGKRCPWQKDTEPFQLGSRSPFRNRS